MNGPGSVATEVIRRQRLPENYLIGTALMGTLTISAAGLYSITGGTVIPLRDPYCNAVAISYATSDATNPGVGMTPETLCVRIGQQENVPAPTKSDLYIFTSVEVRGTLNTIPLFCLCYYVTVYRVSTTALWFPNVVFS